MRTVLYLYRKALENRINKAVKKPSTYIWIVVMVAYLIMMGYSFGNTFRRMKLNNPQGLALCLSIITMALVPANFITFSKRKGLIFKQCDVHFLFPAPVSPKILLLYAYVRNLIMDFIILLFAVPIGIRFFHVSPVRMIAYFFISFFVENAMEMSVMILLYGNERLGEKGVKAICWLIRCVLMFLVVYALYLLEKGVPGIHLLKQAINDPVIQAIPIIGWFVAMIQLVFVGITKVNLICTILYFVCSFVIIALAYFMKCTGAYYEDAMKFADDYAEARAKSKKGQVAIIGKKQKFKAAMILYKGTGAKAIYYKQLLEYKKTKYFIFGFYHILCLVCGIGCAIVAYNEADFMRNMGIFILPGVCAYISFLSSGFAQKWQKEIENPYTFLIPDSSIKKLWYATKIEHIRSVVSGSLIVIPTAIVARYNPIITILCILTMVCLEANKIYCVILGECIFSGRLGTMGKQMLKLIIQGTAIGLGVGGALLGYIVSGQVLGFTLMCITLFATAISMMLIGMNMFEQMERAR